MIGVGKGASHLNLNSGTCKTCGTGKTDDCLNLTGGACENPAMLNSANCLIYCPTRLTCPTRPSVRSTLHSQFITRTKKGKTFYSPWHIARCLEEPRDPTRDRGNIN